MSWPILRRALLIVLVGIVAGCAAKSSEKPIVLRRPIAAHRTPAAAGRHPAVTRPPAPAPVAAPAADPQPAPAELTPAEKSALFKDFSRFLSRPGAVP